MVYLTRPSQATYTRWFKYDRDKLWLVYTQIVPVLFEPPCIYRQVNTKISVFVYISYLPVSYDS
jgi:hypothetical protein